MNQFINYLLPLKILPARTQIQCNATTTSTTTQLCYDIIDSELFIHSEYQIQSIDIWSSWSGHTEHKPTNRPPCTNKTCKLNREWDNDEERDLQFC